MDAITVPHNTGINTFITKINFNSRRLGIEIRGLFSIRHHKKRGRVFDRRINCINIDKDIQKIVNQALGRPPGDTCLA